MKGTVWKFGDDIDTDIILPGRYLIYTDEEKLSQHCMEGLDDKFNEKCKKGDFIVAGKNFGCGSSREQAPGVLKALGVKAVIAKSFDLFSLVPYSHSFGRTGATASFLCLQI